MSTDATNHVSARLLLRRALDEIDWQVGNQGVPPPLRHAEGVIGDIEKFLGDTMSTDSHTQQIEQLTQERDAWMSTAAQYLEGSRHHEALLIRIGKVLGRDAYVCDDGSVSDEILIAKVPELVEKMAREYFGRGVVPPLDQHEAREAAAARRHVQEQTAKAPRYPTCPTCNSSAQVWPEQVTGVLRCHRAGCHTEVLPQQIAAVSQPQNLGIHIEAERHVDQCPHGVPHHYSCAECYVEAEQPNLAHLSQGNSGPQVIPEYRIGTLLEPTYGGWEIDANGKPTFHSVGKVITEAQAFAGTPAEAREALIQWAQANEYQHDAAEVFPSDRNMSLDLALKELQRGARLACAYTNKDGFIAQDAQKLNEVFKARDEREQRYLEGYAKLRLAMIEIYKLTVGITADIGEGPSDQFLCWVPDELRLVLKKLRSKS